VKRGTFALVCIFFLLLSLLFKSGRIDKFTNSILFESWRRYFALEILKEEEEEEEKEARTKRVYLFMPHGVFPFGLTLMAGIEDYGIPHRKASDIKVAIASAFLWVPLLGTVLSWVGCIPCTEHNMRRAIERGICVCVPDGIAGAFKSNRDEEILYLRNRKGLFELLHSSGATVVPVYCFGHTQAFEIWGNFRILETASRFFKFAIVFFRGRSLVPPLPHPHPMTLAFGKYIAPAENAAQLKDHVISELKRLYHQGAKEARDWDKQKNLVVLE